MPAVMPTTLDGVLNMPLFPPAPPPSRWPILLGALAVVIAVLVGAVGCALSFGGAGYWPALKWGGAGMVDALAVVDETICATLFAFAALAITPAALRRFGVHVMLTGAYAVLPPAAARST